MKKLHPGHLYIAPDGTPHLTADFFKPSSESVWPLQTVIDGLHVENDGGFCVNQGDNIYVGHCVDSGCQLKGPHSGPCTVNLDDARTPSEGAWRPKYEESQAENKRLVEVIDDKNQSMRAEAVKAQATIDKLRASKVQVDRIGHSKLQTVIDGLLVENERLKDDVRALSQSNAGGSQRMEEDLGKVRAFLGDWMYFNIIEGKYDGKSIEDVVKPTKPKPDNVARVRWR